MNDAPEWSKVKLDFNKPGFLNSVIDLDISKITQKTLDICEKDYLNHKDWDIGKIAKASKVAGPLAAWMDSAIKFGKIAVNIEPLRK